MEKISENDPQRGLDPTQGRGSDSGVLFLRSHQWERSHRREKSSAQTHHLPSLPGPTRRTATRMNELMMAREIVRDMDAGRLVPVASSRFGDPYLLGIHINPDARRWRTPQ